jgi:hypothetical protein
MKYHGYTNTSYTHTHTHTHTHTLILTVSPAVMGEKNDLKDSIKQF